LNYPPIGGTTRITRVPRRREMGDRAPTGPGISVGNGRLCGGAAW